MATYSTLYEILKTRVPEAESLSLPELVEKGRSVIFNFNYPIVSGTQYAAEDYKQYFETEFIIKYLTREISRPSFDLWELKLYGELNNIIPYYNQYIESEKWFQEYITNPANNTDYTEEYTRDISSSNSTKSDSTIGNDTQTDAATTTKGTTTDNNVTTTNLSNTTDTKTGADSTSKNTATNTAGTTGSQYPQSEYDELTDYATERSKSTQETDTESTSTSSNTTKTNTDTDSSETVKNESITDSTDTNTVTSKTNASSTLNQKDNGESTETYTFRRYGNIGVQTPGEVFASTRKAFIDTLDMILNDSHIRNLFLQVGGDFGNDWNFD